MKAQAAKARPQARPGDDGDAACSSAATRETPAIDAVLALLGRETVSRGCARGWAQGAESTGGLHGSRTNSESCAVCRRFAAGSGWPWTRRHSPTLPTTAPASCRCIDTATNTVVATIPGVGAVPEGVAVKPDGTRVYVTNSVTAGTVAVIDNFDQRGDRNRACRPSAVWNRRVTPRPRARTWPILAAAPCRWIDTATNTVTATISGHRAGHRRGDRPGGHACLLCRASRAGAYRSSTPPPNTVIATVPSSGFLGLVVNPAGTRVYSGFGGGVAVIDTSTNASLTSVALAAGASPQGLAIKPAGTRVYVTDTNNASVSVIDTATNTSLQQFLWAQRPKVSMSHPTDRRSTSQQFQLVRLRDQHGDQRGDHHGNFWREQRTVRLRKIHRRNCGPATASATRGQIAARYRH
jgi:hypothetical protein